jgi:hypothetical protein
MKNVLIATPSYDGKLDVWYTNALLETVLLGLSNEVTFKPIFLSYDALVQRARNDLMKIAIESEVDGVLWIDADMEWNPGWAVAVANSGKDVVGLPVIKRGIEEGYNVKAELSDLVVDEEGLMKVKGVGTGFLYMSKTAITYLWETSEEYAEPNKTSRMVFEVRVDNGELISEDVTVCNKLREGGFNILIDPSKTCNHVGSLKFVGDFASFVKRVRPL